MWEKKNTTNKTKKNRLKIVKEKNRIDVTKGKKIHHRTHRQNRERQRTKKKKEK